MNKTQKNYQTLHEMSKQHSLLKGISALLDWDQETYMPPGAASNRAEQLKVMAGITHREKTSDQFKDALNQLIDLKTGEFCASDLSAEQQASLKEWRKDYNKATALPSEFVEELAQLQSQAINAWRNAKKENAFQQFAPFLDRIVEMNKRKAEYFGYEEHPYDALLNEYEPDITTKQVTAIFSQLQHFITPLLKKIVTQEIDDSFLTGEWDHSKQMTFAYKLLDAMGYSRDKGRVDFSSHPFSSSTHPTDSRITTRIHPTSLMSNIMVILHEGGHSLYEMGLPVEHFGSPLGEYRSLGIHESQSRWWETRIGLSQPFWKHYFPVLKETFHDELHAIKFDDFYRAINKVKPSLIRVEADEMTYPLHVILRFELEKGLIEGTIKVRDIPELWNTKMKEYIGIEPKNNSEGCLQDIHWAMGAFGYFPTYALGNLYAAHLFEAFAKENPTWEKQVSEGQLDFIREWLQKKIYCHGRKYTTLQLLKKATGQEFSEKAYLNYISNKYGKIYSL